MVYLLLVSFIWAFSFGIIKDNLVGIDSNFVAFARLLIPAVLFLPFIRLQGLQRKTIAKLALIGMLQYGVMYITYIYSFQFLKAYEVALFTILTPLYVTLVNDFLKRRFIWVNLATTILAIIGSAIIVQARLIENTLLTGFFILQISNFCFAFGQLYYKDTLARLPHIKDRQIFGLLYLGAAFITGVTTLAFADLSTIRLDRTQLLSILYLGVIASGIGFFLWNLGARQVNAGALAILNNLKIPLAIIVSLVFFKESAHIPSLAVGGFIILAALILNEWAGRRVPPQQPFQHRETTE